MELAFFISVVVLGSIALVQSFRLYDTRFTIDSYRRAAETAEARIIAEREELRRVEKEHSRMVQMITDFADRLNE